MKKILLSIFLVLTIVSVVYSSYIPKEGVPTQNSSANSTVGQVIGNKTDNHFGDSVYSKTDILEEHIHNVSSVYPTLANGASVVGGGGAWGLGDPVLVVPSNTITSSFDVHAINVGSVSANDTYELVLYYCTVGGTTTEAGRLRFTRSNTQYSSPIAPIMTPIIPASSEITAKIASSSGGDTAVISIYYHIY